MFSTNLRTIIYFDSLKLTKSIYCGVGLLEKAQPKCISHRCFITKPIGKANQSQVIINVRAKNVIHRQITTRRPKLSSTLIKWKTLAIVASLGSVFLAAFNYFKNEKLKRREILRNRALGKAQLGGKFNLVDQDNKPFSSDDLLGNWLLLYFGFTHCPDICPDEIEKMVEVVDKIDKSDDIMKVKPIFITVDPERDTPGIIKKYLKEFSDKIIGLTGTVEQIASTCKAFRVYFSPGPKDSDADYIVDHSIIMYLIDPQGNFIDYYGQNKNADEIVTSIRFNQMKQSMINKSTFQKMTDFLKKE